MSERRKRGNPSRVNYKKLLEGDSDSDDDFVSSTKRVRDSVAASTSNAPTNNSAGVPSKRLSRDEKMFERETELVMKLTKAADTSYSLSGTDESSSYDDSRDDDDDDDFIITKTKKVPPKGPKPKPVKQKDTKATTLTTHSLSKKMPSLVIPSIALKAQPSVAMTTTTAQTSSNLSTNNSMPTQLVKRNTSTDNARNTSSIDNTRKVSGDDIKNASIDSTRKKISIDDESQQPLAENLAPNNQTPLDKPSSGGSCDMPPPADKPASSCKLPASKTSLTNNACTASGNGGDGGGDVNTRAITNGRVVNKLTEKWTPPGKIDSKATPSLSPSPSSGLRVGLSRKANIKPLHNKITTK